MDLNPPSLRSYQRQLMRRHNSSFTPFPFDAVHVSASSYRRVTSKSKENDFCQSLSHGMYVSVSLLYSGVVLTLSDCKASLGQDDVRLFGWVLYEEALSHLGDISLIDLPIQLSRMILIFTSPSSLP